MSIGDIRHRESRVERTIQKLKTCEHISDHNRELLLEFKDFIQAQDLSLDRTCRDLYSWYQLTEIVDFELDNPDKKDLVELVRKIHRDELWDDATKYEVSESDTIQIVEPERKNITVTEMKSIVEQTSNSNSTSPEVQQGEERTESGFDIIAVLEAAVNWVF